MLRAYGNCAKDISPVGGIFSLRLAMALIIVNLYGQAGAGQLK
jgi:hypothetical protein